MQAPLWQSVLLPILSVIAPRGSLRDWLWGVDVGCGKGWGDLEGGWRQKRSGAHSFPSDQQAKKTEQISNNLAARQSAGK